MRNHARFPIAALVAGALLAGCAGLVPARRDCAWIEPLSYCLAPPGALTMLHGRFRLVTVSRPAGRRDFLAVVTVDETGLEISASGLSGQPLFLVRYGGDTVTVSPPGALPSPGRLVALLQFAYLTDDQLAEGLRDAPPNVRMQSDRRGRRLLVNGDSMLEVETRESGTRIHLPGSDVEVRIRPVSGLSGPSGPETDRVAEGTA